MTNDTEKNNNSNDKKTVREVFDSSAIRDNPAARENLVVNLPNLISALRIGVTPLLIWFAISQMHQYFLIGLLLALATDGIDGYLARKLHQETRFGAQLDSWADVIIYTVMLFALWQLWPLLFERESGYLIMAFSGWLVSVLFALVRFHRLPSYHTYASKLAAIGLAPSYFVLVIWDIFWPFRAVMIFFVWIALEQLLITAILHRWQRDVGSVLHALHIVRDEQRNKTDQDIAS